MSHRAQQHNNNRGRHDNKGRVGGDSADPSSIDRTTEHTKGAEEPKKSKGRSRPQHPTSKKNTKKHVPQQTGTNFKNRTPTHPRTNGGKDFTRRAPDARRRDAWTGAGAVATDPGVGGQEAGGVVPWGTGPRRQVVRRLSVVCLLRARRSLFPFRVFK